MEYREAYGRQIGPDDPARRIVGILPPDRCSQDIHRQVRGAGLNLVSLVGANGRPDEWMHFHLSWVTAPGETVPTVDADQTHAFQGIQAATQILRGRGREAFEV